ncbi:hypothetical protein BST61_g171 [Cercospora zeina]
MRHRIMLGNGLWLHCPDSLSLPHHDNDCWIIEKAELVMTQRLDVIGYLELFIGDISDSRINTARPIELSRKRSLDDCFHPAAELGGFRDGGSVGAKRELNEKSPDFWTLERETGHDACHVHAVILPFRYFWGG